MCSPCSPHLSPFTGDPERQDEEEGDQRGSINHVKSVKTCEGGRTGGRGWVIGVEPAATPKTEAPSSGSRGKGGEEKKEKQKDDYDDGEYEEKEEKWVGDGRGRAKKIKKNTNEE